MINTFILKKFHIFATGIYPNYDIPPEELLNFIQKKVILDKDNVKKKMVV